jgi:hypothetical protein
MARKKLPPAPPLDWLRQSVWSGEELPDELVLLEAIEPARTPRTAPARKRASRSKRPGRRQKITGKT